VAGPAVENLSYEQVAKTIDHSLLRPELDLDFVLAFAVELLDGSDVFVSTVVGFPHGSSATETKVFESKRAIELGAREIDMVLNIGRLKSGRADEVRDDIAAVVSAAAAKEVIVKVIFENAYLDDAQKELACRLSEEAGAAFVKTSTGFAPGGATIDDLKLMRRCVGPHVQVKAAGGVRTLDALLEVMAVGVTRIGATATETILEEFKARKAAVEHAAVG
jgi:deoxyribose-phosphate aldolase